MTYLASALFVLSSTTALAVSPEVCRMRGDLLQGVAQERDKGVSKAEVMRKLGNKLAGMRPYVDIVYRDMKDMPPSFVRDFVIDTCIRTGN
jgi:hypothetical protein